MSLIARLLNEEPLPPARLNAETPAGLSDLVLSLLEESPEARVQTADELADRLRTVQ